MASQKKAANQAWHWPNLSKVLPCHYSLDPANTQDGLYYSSAFLRYHPQILMEIHQTAVVNPSAQLAADVRIGPYAVIEDEAEIGQGCEVGAHAVIKRFTSLGRRNRVFEHAVLGGEPQDIKFKGESSRLIVGDDNMIREFCTLHRACGEGETTRIGSRNFLMVGVHVAHNCIVGDDNVFANGAALAGHINVEDH